MLVDSDSARGAPSEEHGESVSPDADAVIIDEEGNVVNPEQPPQKRVCCRTVSDDDDECWCRGWRRFTQQRQNGFVPVYTPKVTIMVMLCLTAIFVAIGIPSLVESNNVQDVKVRYDDQCDLESTCPVSITLDNANLVEDVNKHGKKLYLYYEIKKQYQNVRRYVDSVSWGQLRDNGPDGGKLGRCRPEKYITREPNDALEDDGIVLPCGLTPWSYFNDTIRMQVDGGIEVPIDESNIAWKEDLKHLYSNIETVNFNTIPAYAGGGMIDGPIDEDEHFAVWMRLGTRNQFRKLYGIVQTSTASSQPLLNVGDTLTFIIENNYNTYNFNGEKKVVLSTLSFLGGRNDFTGILFLILGGLFLCTAVFVSAVTAFSSSSTGDLSRLSWVREEYEEEEYEEEEYEED